MYYALMRPSKAAALTTADCYLPDNGWGHLTFADSSPAPGRAFTDDGIVHEHRGLKGRNKGRPNIDAPARRPTRRMPIPPELVALLREHIARFDAGPDERLFRSANGNPIQPSTWWQAAGFARRVSRSQPDDEPQGGKPSCWGKLATDAQAGPFRGQGGQLHA